MSYIIIVFLPLQWCRFTVTVVDFHILFYDSSSSMTSTTRWVFWLHWKLIFWAIKLSLYIFYFFLRAQWCHFTVTIVDCYILKFSAIPHHGLVQPLVRIAAFVIITLLRYRIITIYHLFFSPRTIAYFHRHNLWVEQEHGQPLFCFVGFMLRWIDAEVGVPVYMTWVYMCAHKYLAAWKWVSQYFLWRERPALLSWSGGGKGYSMPAPPKEFLEKGEIIGLLLRLTCPIWATSKLDVHGSGFCVVKGCCYPKRKRCICFYSYENRRYWPKYICGDDIKARFKKKQVGDMDVWRSNLYVKKIYVHCLK